MKKTYLFQNKKALFFLKGLDYFLSIYVKLFSRKKKATSFPKKILLSHIAHLGDVIIATSVLPIIKKQYPAAKIGFLTSSFSAQALQDHPYIDHVYLIDHWKLNRASLSLGKKILVYFRTRKKALREIRREKYDIAIDLYYHFPNTIDLFWRAKIPTRVGYTSAGFGPLLTHPVDWIDRREYVSSYYCDLLQKIFPLEKKPLSPCVLFREPFARKTLFLDQKYIVIHPCKGTLMPMWPEKKWKELVRRLSEKNISIFFTGKGLREKELVDRIMDKNPSCQSLVDSLSFQELAYVVKNASVVIAVDTAIVHLADSFSTKTLVIFCGINDPLHWAPPEAFVLISKRSCVPCHIREGCSGMNCTYDVSVEEVYEKAIDFLERDYRESTLSSLPSSDTVAK